MTGEHIPYIIWGFTALWFFGGLALFYWVKYQTWNRQAKSALNSGRDKLLRAYRLVRDHGPIYVMFFGIYFIPLVVTVICLHFNP